MLSNIFICFYHFTDRHLENPVYISDQRLQRRKFTAMKTCI